MLKINYLKGFVYFDEAFFIKTSRLLLKLGRVYFSVWFKIVKQHH